MLCYLNANESLPSLASTSDTLLYSPLLSSWEQKRRKGREERRKKRKEGEKKRKGEKEGRKKRRKERRKKRKEKKEG